MEISTDDPIHIQEPAPNLVVLVTNVSSGITGGIIEYLAVLKVGLSDEGLKVRSLEFPRVLNLMESRGLPRVARIPLHMVFVVTCLLRIALLRRRHDGILVHSHGASYALFAAYLARKFGSPAVHTFHSPVKGPSTLLRLVSPGTDGLVFVSRSLSELLGSTCHVANRSIHIIPGAVDTSMFAPVTPEEKASSRHEFLSASGLPDRGQLGVFLGRITPDKGVMELVEAAGHLKALGSPISILIAGPTLQTAEAERYHKSVVQRIRELDVQDRIALVGPVVHSSKRRLLAAADVLLCPSKWDASPIAVVEALASGVPVVAFRVGGLAERIRDGETGWLVEPGNTQKFAETVDRLVLSESTRRDFGRRAREEACRLYGRSLFIAKHIRMYASILANSSA